MATLGLDNFFVPFGEPDRMKAAMAQQSSSLVNSEAGGGGGGGTVSDSVTAAGSEAAVNQGRLTSLSRAESSTTVGGGGGGGSSSVRQLTRQESAATGVSSSSQPKSYDDAPSDADTVLIEEKRKKPHGEGYTLHKYLRGKLLGKGGFAKVYLCTAMDTNKQYAVKIVPKANLVKARARQKLQAEIKIHRTLKHKHICEYKHFFEDRNNCYILLELCHNQSLNEMIKRRKRLTEPEAAYFMTQLLEAVIYMHDANVIHRDLKLGNLFLDKNMSVKVGDLGLATRLEDREEKRKTICGTPNYIAPEVIQGDKATRGHSFEVDIWSMGVILYTVLVGKPPYEAKDVKATYQRILANEYRFPAHLPLSDCVKDLIGRMLQSKPAERPSLEAIGKHPFLSENTIPYVLPSTVLSSPPKWHVTDHGDLVVDDGTLISRKPWAASSSSSGNRRPFGTHDPNTGRAPFSSAASKVSSAVSSIRKERSAHIDMQRIVRSALTMSGGNGGSVATATSTTSGNAKSYQPSPAFRIYVESKDGNPDSNSKTPSKGRSKTPSRSTALAAEDELVARTKALTIAGGSYASSTSSRSHSVHVAAQTPAPSSPDNDYDIVERMLEQLETVLEITESRRGSYRPNSPRNVSSRGGPMQWVTRYVDYTSKYGLGFLLNNGCSGVYFNDSTKTVIESQGDVFQYIERRRVDDASRLEVVVETHTLEKYPECLKKKVTLLKHFRNYLINEQKKAGGNDDDELSGEGGAYRRGQHLAFVKKWIRTKHAILFRLSNQTIQVVFYDQTEVLLTPDARFITYVDKSHKRQTYSFSDELVGSFPELEKRLKYTKDIMSQLLTSSSRRTP